MKKSNQRFIREAASLVKEGPKAFGDLSGHERTIGGRLVPRNFSDVVRIVQLATRHGIQLHAVSCGRNWGFGSALPAANDVWLVDLSELTQIEFFDPESGTVLIEPGVTQGQLSERLIAEGNDWLFNVTGAGDSTSLVGNALERGIGYYGQRHLDLLELEIVTGTGEVISTNLGNQDRAAHPAPLGCDATSLFFQSSFGIVTKARLRLIRRTDGNGVVMARLKDPKKIAKFFERIIELKRDEVIAGVPHIANRPRLTTTMLPWLPKDQHAGFEAVAAPWTAALPLLGKSEITEAQSKIIHRALRKIGTLEAFLGGKVEFKRTGCSPMEQFRQLASGYPSNLALPGVQWCALQKADMQCLDPEKTSAGLIHITPAIPSSNKEIRRALKVVNQTAQSLSIDPLPITVNVVNTRFSVLVISLPFVRPDVSVHERAMAIQKALSQAGYLPYRMGLSQANGAFGFSKASFALMQEIKKAFDPKGVFAISKYEPDSSWIRDKARRNLSIWDEDNGYSLLEAA